MKNDKDDKTEERIRPPPNLHLAGVDSDEDYYYTDDPPLPPIIAPTKKAPPPAATKATAGPAAASPGVPQTKSSPAALGQSAKASAPASPAAAAPPSDSTKALLSAAAPKPLGGGATATAVVGEGDKKSTPGGPPATYGGGPAVPQHVDPAGAAASAPSTTQVGPATSKTEEKKKDDGESAGNKNKDKETEKSKEEMKKEKEAEKALKKEKEQQLKKEREEQKKREKAERLQQRENNNNAAEGEAASAEAGGSPDLLTVQGMLDMLMDIPNITAFKQRIFFWAFLCYLVVGLFFLILQCPLSQLDEAGGGCFTFWGYKAQCDSVSYTFRPETIPCQAYSSKLQLGAAFSILSILLYFALALWVWKIVSDFRNADRRHKKQYTRILTGEEGQVRTNQKPLIVLGVRKWILIGLFSASFVFELICFAVVASLYSARPCQDHSAQRTTAYGNGFGLLVTTWCFSLLFLPSLIYMSIVCE